MGKLKTPLFLTGIFSGLDGKFINFKKNICKIEWVKKKLFEWVCFGMPKNVIDKNVFSRCVQ